MDTAATPTPSVNDTADGSVTLKMSSSTYDLLVALVMTGMAVVNRDLPASVLFGKLADRAYPSAESRAELATVLPDAATEAAMVRVRAKALADEDRV